MSGRKRLRSEMRNGFPRCGIRRRDVLHGELDWADEFRPGFVEPAYLRHQHIVEHTASCTVLRQSCTEHGCAHAAAMTIAVCRSFPRYLMHVSYHIRVYTGNMRYHGRHWLNEGKDDHAGCFRTSLGRCGH